MVTFLAACSSEHSDPIQQPINGEQPADDTNNDSGVDDTDPVEPVELSFEVDILPIIEQRCTACHNQGSGLADYTNYQTSFNSTAKLLNRVTILKDMPRNNVTGMTQPERDLFAQWINEGAMP